MTYTKQLINELKLHNQDFEWYPTTKEMIKPIYQKLGYHSSILDIGGGTCTFKRYINEINDDLKSDPNNYNKYGGYELQDKTYQYHVIEKSKILIDKLDKDTIVLGTDFHNTLLLDKPVDVIFCNPPYSEFVEWVCKILSTGNYKVAYLVIPQRWKSNPKINEIIKTHRLNIEILGNFDFSNAERQARAKVDVIEIVKHTSSDYNELAFNEWFNETFSIDTKTNDIMSESEHKQHIKNKLVSSDETKITTLVKLYNAELKTLLNHFHAITSMDADILETIGVNYTSIKNAIKHKTKNLKTLYWRLVFDELDEITDRLTKKSRDALFAKFERLSTIEFSDDNIYSLVIWVIKNANSYYNDQLIEWYQKISHKDHVTPYKSNHKFNTDTWRYNKQTHYTLDYRIICTWIFQLDWHGDLDEYENLPIITDITAIINNLGFKVARKDLPKEFGKKYYMYDQNDTILLEYKVYRNRNTHIKFNIEVLKALNIEISRLLGWIRSVDDIEREFPKELSKDAHKYFRSNLQLSPSNQKLLGKGE
jgi:hypothetical protein